MRKWTGKTTQAGCCLFLAALLLTGCSGESETEKKVAAEQKTETERTAETERPEVQSVSNPSFIQDGIRKVILTKDGEEIFHLSKEPADYKMEFDYWEILNPYDETMTVNTEEMYQLFDALCEFDLRTPVAVADGTDTGLEDSSTIISLEFVNTLDAEQAKKTEYADSGAEIILGNEDGSGYRFAAVKGQEDQVYKLSSASVEAIFSLNPYDYILKIPVLINIETVQSIELAAEDKTYEMWVDKEKETYRLGKKNVEKETFTELYQALSSVMLDGEPEVQAGAEQGDPMLTVTYHRNTENAPDIQVAYYEYEKDDTHCLAEINGNRQFLVKTQDVKTLTEQIKDAF